MLGHSKSLFSVPSQLSGLRIMGLTPGPKELSKVTPGIIIRLINFSGVVNDPVLVENLLLLYCMLQGINTSFVYDLIVNFE